MVGAVVGLAVGLRLTRGFDRYVFLVDPGSPWMVVATALVLFGSALGASLLPALRASRVDPVRVLRTE